MRENDKNTIEEQNKSEKNLTSEDILSAFMIDWVDYKILRKSNSKTEGEQLWLNIKNSVPIYYLEWFWVRKWSYHIKEDYILMFSNADEETLKHEIIHSIEYKQNPTPELEDFFIKVKNTISEDSFENWAVSFNFAKNIHEFLADWYSKTIFINALKKENLYDEFLEKTKYIFE